MQCSSRKIVSVRNSRPGVANADARTWLTEAGRATRPTDPLHGQSRTHDTLRNHPYAREDEPRHAV